MVRYRKIPGPSFCGVYVLVVGNLSEYATMSFWVKGARGGETFELGMNDVVSNKREDAVIVGSIHRNVPSPVALCPANALTPEVRAAGIVLCDKDVVTTCGREQR